MESKHKECVWHGAWHPCLMSATNARLIFLSFFFCCRESFRVCPGSCAHPRWLHGIDYYPDLCVLLAGTVRFQEALKKRWGWRRYFRISRGRS